MSDFEAQVLAALADINKKLEDLKLEVEKVAWIYLSTFFCCAERATFDL